MLATISAVFLALYDVLKKISVKNTANGDFSVGGLKMER